MSLRGVLAAVLALAAIAVCARLGLWQLDRLDQRRAHNAVIVSAMTAEPVALTRIAAEVREDAEALRYRAVTASGHFEAPELIIRARSLDGRPGVHLVSSFRMEDGRRILVLRGWLPSADGAHPDTVVRPPSGRQEVSGLLIPISRGDRAARPVELSVQGRTMPSVRRLDETVLQTLQLDVLPVLVQLGDRASGGLPEPVPAPEISEGRHLSYALQWFSFALIFLVGSLVVAWRGAGAARRALPSAAPQDQRSVRAPEPEGVRHHGSD